MAFVGVESGSGVGTFYADSGSLLYGKLQSTTVYHSEIVGDRVVTLISQSGIPNKEMIHQAWKEGSQICESLSVTAGTTETVQKCYLGKFNASLLQETCVSDVKTNYYPLIGGVIGALGLYKSIKAFQDKRNVQGCAWFAVCVVGLAVLSDSLFPVETTVSW